MYITKQLREYDAAVLSVGSWTNVLGHYIPPGLSYAHNRAFMYGECTEDIFPETGINVFWSFLHMHTIGVASTLRIVRDGREIAPIDSNLNYELSTRNYLHTLN